MENQIIKFTNGDWNIRTIGNGKEALFCLIDIAKSLCYKDPSDAIKKYCKEGTILMPTDTLTSNGTCSKVRIKWGDIGCVFSLIMKSRAKRAEEFQNWVCREVLPSIFLTGKYETGNEFQSKFNEGVITFMDSINGSIHDLMEKLILNEKRLNQLEDCTANMLSNVPPSQDNEDRKPSKTSIDLIVTTCPSFLSRIVRLLTDMNEEIMVRTSEDKCGFDVIVIDYSEDAREALEEVYGRKQAVSIKVKRHGKTKGRPEVPGERPQRD